jgi:hypothetical protein
MKYKKLLALALVAATSPAFASSFTVDFEKTWDYANGDVNNYYNGGAAADGSTGGSNLGVSFVNVSGLSNDSLTTYYSNALSILGVAYAHDTAFINVAAGVDNALSLWYSSSAAVTGAVTAWTGLNGTGINLGSFDLAANSSSAYDGWSATTFNFIGTAQSFNLTTAGVNNVAIDNISAVPVPAAAWLFGTGLAMFGAVRRGGKASV